MSDEAESRMTQHSGRHSADEWLLGIVRQLVLSIMDERDKRYEERFLSQQEAITKADLATEKRFASVNEFRAMITDRDAMYMPRSESASQFEAVQEKLESHSREDAIAHLNFGKRLDELSKRVDTAEGTVIGSKSTLSIVVGAAVLLVALITIGTFVFSNKPVAPPQVYYVPAAPGTLVPSIPQPTPR